MNVEQKRDQIPAEICIGVEAPSEIGVIDQGDQRQLINLLRTKQYSQSQ